MQTKQKQKKLTVTLCVVHFQSTSSSPPSFTFRFAEMTPFSRSVAWHFLSFVFKSLVEEEKRSDESWVSTLSWVYLWLSFLPPLCIRPEFHQRQPCKKPWLILNVRSVLQFLHDRLVYLFQSKNLVTSY